MNERRIDTLATGHAHPHPEPISGAAYSAVELLPNSNVLMLDQRLLPNHEKYEILTRPEEVAAGIRELRVRGAPAIGIAAAYGVALAAACTTGDAGGFAAEMERVTAMLLATRPTAVNLAWALGEMRKVWTQVASHDHASRLMLVADRARAIHHADVAACRAMGKIGAAHVPDLPEGVTILTHCNAGALATGGYGTALGVIRAARDAGKRVNVLADETRPVLQGARLTAWELHKDGIPVNVITDSMAAYFMRKERIACVVVGADRIARNGDVANKIGTYGLACIARAHGVPFYVAAPTSTVDLGTATGDQIVIEERSEDEVTLAGESRTRTVPSQVHARNPAFDITPAELITAIFTEVGEARAPFAPTLSAFVATGQSSKLS
jgi:methylthioribose-1-phosphate isomerase